MSKGKMITEGDLLFDQDPRRTTRPQRLRPERPVGQPAPQGDSHRGGDRGDHRDPAPLRGNVGTAATQLHIGKTTLYDKMKQRGISPKVLRKPD